MPTPCPLAGRAPAVGAAVAGGAVRDLPAGAGGGPWGRQHTQGRARCPQPPVTPWTGFSPPVPSQGTSQPKLPRVSGEESLRDSDRESERAQGCQRPAPTPQGPPRDTLPPLRPTRDGYGGHPPPPHTQGAARAPLLPRQRVRGVSSPQHPDPCVPEDTPGTAAGEHGGAHPTTWTGHGGPGGEHSRACSTQTPGWGCLWVPFVPAAHDIGQP